MAALGVCRVGLNRMGGSGLRGRGRARMAAKGWPVSGARAMATRTVNARFTNGALTPLEPLDLPEGVLVELNIRTLDDAGPDAPASVGDEEKTQGCCWPCWRSASTTQTNSSAKRRLWRRCGVCGIRMEIRYHALAREGWRRRVLRVALHNEGCYYETVRKDTRRAAPLGFWPTARVKKGPVRTASLRSRPRQRGRFCCPVSSGVFVSHARNLRRIR